MNNLIIKTQPNKTKMLPLLELCRAFYKGMVCGVCFIFSILIQEFVFSLDS